MNLNKLSRLHNPSSRVFPNEINSGELIMPNSCMLAVCHAKFFGDNYNANSSRPSSVFVATSMETTADHSLLVSSFLLGVPPLKLVCQTLTLFHLFFGCNFPTNDNQTFIVYMKSMLILLLFRKGLCGFSSFKICPRRKLHGAICCKYWGPEGERMFFIPGNTLL